MQSTPNRVNYFSLSLRATSLFCLTLVAMTPIHGSTQDEDAEAAVMRRAADIVRPSLVRLDVTGLGPGGNARGSTATTGLVVAEDGWIVSSTYGFVDDPEVILATFDDGERTRARIIARDKSRKLILLKTEPTQQLSIPEFIGLADVEVGQSVVAVGRVLDRQQPNLSLGIVSAKRRIWGKALQTDAKLSPNNYGGPLCDWRGRVIGLIVPFSPQSESESAGVEWYDSGIGFAVPSEALINALPRLSEGEDLHAGVLGISPESGNLLRGPVIVGSCLPRSPADRAGIHVGDQIVQINGKLILRYADLRHAIGPLYAGDVCNIEFERDGSRQQVQVTLVDRIPPFAHGYLGVLPKRWPIREEGVEIRFVVPMTPAADLALRAGDVIQSINGDLVRSVEQAHRLLAGFEANDQVELTVFRDGESVQHSIRLAESPSTKADDIPSAYEIEQVSESLSIDSVQTLQLPEESVACFVRLPREFRQEIPHSLLIWIDRPGVASQERLEEQWGALCDSMPLIVMTPQTANPDAWNPTDADFVRRSIDAAISEYPVDPNLVVVGGFQSGGSLAMMVGVQNRDIVRGVATMDAVIVSQVFEAANMPLQRFSFLFVVSQLDRLGLPTMAAQRQLQQAHFPVESVELKPKRDGLRIEDRELIRDWIDRLDRF